MRFVVILALLLTGCGSTPRPRDLTQESWYGQDVSDLTAMDRQADDAFKAGKNDEAAAIIQKAQPLMKTILGVSHPTLEAAEAASDLDD